MKRILTAAMLLVTTLGGMAQEWPTLTQTAKPAARWWWLGSAVDEANLGYNMEEYARAGLGELEITPIYGVQGNEENELSFLTPEWMRALEYTQAKGDEVGIRIDMSTGTGWPFGGPETSLHDAATKAIFEQYTVQGGQAVELPIAVANRKDAPSSTLDKVMAYQGSKHIDVTKKCDEKGVLRWQAPEGEWQVIALFVGKTRQAVKRAAPGGEGYVIDHLSKGAVKRYLGRFEKAFKASGTAAPNNFFNDSYEVYGADWTPDFLEQFARRRGYRLEHYFREFLDEERPEITCRIVSDYRETVSDLLLENFTDQWTRWAHRMGSVTRNQAHGSPANLIDTYAAVDIPECEGFGLSEFGIEGLRRDSLTRKNDSDLSMLKYASSAAHISGKPLVSSETFTWLTEHFRTSLSQCKPDMDLMFVSGVNHMFFHGTPYSPREAEWPGWSFYASINMSPTNSIWRDAPAFFDYIGRCQSFLQMGKPDNDFLVYLPVYDLWNEQPGRLLAFDIHKMHRVAPKFIATVNEICNNGYDVDYISDSFVRTTRCVDGQLVTSGGAAYKAIIVPGVKRMPADVLARLEKLARAGATVVFIGGIPEDVPGYGNLEARRKVFGNALKGMKSTVNGQQSTVNGQQSTVNGQQSTVNSQQSTATPPEDNSEFRIQNSEFTIDNCQLGKGRIIIGDDYRETLALCGVQPEEVKTQHGMQYIRRRNDKGHHYFISALQPEGMDGWVTLSVADADAMIFDPVTGEKGRAATRATDKGLQVYLQLKSGQSLIVQTFDAPVEADNWCYLQPQTLALTLDHGWKLDFVVVNGQRSTVNGQQSTVNGQQSTVNGQQSTVDSRQSTVNSQQSTATTPEDNSEFRIQNSKLTIDTPRSWTTLDIPEATTMMGTGRYTLEFDLPAMAADEWVLDLGDVRESARVRINGKEVGTAWCVPFQLTVGKYLQPGKNILEVEVTNLPANRIAELDRQQVPWRRFKEINVVDLNYKKTGYAHWAPLPSGLNGQVKLIPMRSVVPQ